MKSTGIVRNVDSLGRVVLPKELRRKYGIETNTPLEIFTEGDSILLRRYQPSGACEFCGEIRGDVMEYRGHFICAECRRAITEL